MDSLKEVISGLAATRPELEEAKYYEDLDSTNQAAVAWAKEKPGHPALLVANGQRAGKGRLQRKWDSPRGMGIYGSLLIYPQLKPQQAALLTLSTGLATAKVLRGMGAGDILIKWPNDLILNKKKIAGILSEMEVQGGKVQFVVLGIGINVHQKDSDFPEELRKTAGSLKSLTGRDWDRGEILAKLVPELFKEVEALKGEGSEVLIRRWEKESGMLGKEIRALIGNQEKGGIVEGLSPEGHLKIRQKNGEIFELVAEDTQLV